MYCFNYRYGVMENYFIFVFIYVPEYFHSQTPEREESWAPSLVDKLFHLSKSLTHSKTSSFHSLTSQSGSLALSWHRQTAYTSVPFGNLWQVQLESLWDEGRSCCSRSQKFCSSGALRQQMRHKDNVELLSQTLNRIWEMFWPYHLKNQMFYLEADRNDLSCTAKYY